MGLKSSIGLLQRAMVNLVFAPFVALAALFGMLFIALSFAIKSVEAFIGIFGPNPNLGGEWMYEFGKKNLPNFYFS